MLNNSELKRLHMERIARTGNAVEEKKTEEDKNESFECPVCYTDGAEFGLASPACGHQVCLSCYSNILLRGGEDTKCPCCRKPYFKPAINPAQADPYYGLPPLISSADADYHLFTRFITANRVQGNVHLMNIIADMGVLANSLDDLMEAPEQQTMT